MLNRSSDASSAAALYSSLNGGAASSTGSAVAETQDRFLKLLVTQMKNQDPLNPMDNAQVTTQMAQLSTVTGIDKLNATLQALSSNMMGNQTLQAASMIGHGVLTPGNGLELIKGNAYGAMDLSENAGSVEISINDSKGALVKTIRLGEQPAGLTNWMWDGKDESGNVVQDGVYSFSVVAKQGGTTIPAQSMQFGKVDSVTRTEEGITLDIGYLGSIRLEDVRQIF